VPRGVDPQGLFIWDECYQALLVQQSFVNYVYAKHVLKPSGILLISDVQQHTIIQYKIHISLLQLRFINFMQRMQNKAKNWFLLHLWGEVSMH
jgi:hypothetical protein